jgi:uncharacterized protein YndB with AHSA1/START domain
MSTDRIEKKIVMKAPRARVWRAIASSEEFGRWFGMAFDGPFAPGAPVVGRITSPGKYADARVEIVVDRVEPERLLSYRWHPYAVDPAVDYSAEPMTLVEFRLEDVDGGTELTVVESGFDGIPPARRAEALRMNEGGWAQQVSNIARHVGA